MEVLKVEVEEGKELEVIVEVAADVLDTLEATILETDEEELREIEEPEEGDAAEALVTGRQTRDVEEVEFELALACTEEAIEIIELEVFETTDEEEAEAVEFGRV